jgi:hypothetical protein
MKGFRYALQTLLATRAWALRDVQAALADCQGKLTRQEQIRAQLERRHALVVGEWTGLAASSAALSVEQFAARAGFLADLQRQLDDAVATEAGIFAEQQRLMQEVGQARRALDSVEEHREAALNAFRAKHAAAGFRQADDQWIMQTIRETQDGHQA